MPPGQHLPFPAEFSDVDSYIASLLNFSQNSLFQTLCGGVHILDFFTRDVSDTSTASPKDLYHSILPAEWIGYFTANGVEEVLDILMRRDLGELEKEGGCPENLRVFIGEIRSHSLRREFARRETSDKKSVGIEKRNGGEWALNAGMKPKKIHEVENFSAFVDNLVSNIAAENPGQSISHILDFGSGQAYLSRTLAKKYSHHVVGIESRTTNIEGAKEMDERFDNLAKKREKKKTKANRTKNCIKSEQVEEGKDFVGTGGGSLQYIEKMVKDGNLGEVVDAIQGLSVVKPSVRKANGSGGYDGAVEGEEEGDRCADGECALGNRLMNSRKDKRLLLISLHSCGNLVHHALKAFMATKEVKAVALIGCCYNLMTEKLGKTFKPPFRELHPRLLKTSSATDPHGFPLSNRLTNDSLTLNITARMMACQAPQNWTAATSSAFFTRHFFRALLQRLFLDKGLISPPSATSPSATPSGGEPIIIGSLRKKCYESFNEYVQGAIKKLGWEDKISVSEEEVRAYEERFMSRKKDLSITWSLMAFCAGVVESLVVVDRYLFLREGVERGELRECWVEAAFEYQHSPRNLVVVGIR
ncbi:hypothetical protein RUND412_002070 [Rhizina undulata]